VAEKAVEPAADQRADNADDDVRDAAARRRTGNDPAGDQTDDKPENNPTENSQSVSSFEARTGTQPFAGGLIHTMKRSILCLLVTFAMANGGAAAAQGGVTEITASGSGSVSQPPDTATIDASIETTADNADQAIARNNAIYERIVTALTGIGVARDDIALSYYNVNYNPRPAIVPPNGAERYGYTVSRTFSVKVRQISSAGRVSDACISSGATAINGVSFGLSNSSGARAEATRKAVGEARSNAQTLAEAAGLRVVAIKSMELGGASSGPMPMMRATANAIPPTQFDQSNVNVTVTVSVVFLAEP
jgi:uncharacterized protein YggE